VTSTEDSLAYPEPARRPRLSPVALGRYLASSGARRRAAGLVDRRWLLALWWLLSAMLLAVLVVVTRPAPAEIVPIGPAEDDPETLAAPPPTLAPRVGLASPDDSVLPPAAAEEPGLSVATGGPPLPLREAPDPSAAVLVQVPDGARLDDLGDLTDDGAWRHVSWDGWEGWIAAGVLRRR